MTHFTLKKVFLQIKKTKNRQSKALKHNKPVKMGYSITLNSLKILSNVA